MFTLIIPAAAAAFGLVPVVTGGAFDMLPAFVCGIAADMVAAAAFLIGAEIHNCVDAARDRRRDRAAQARRDAARRATLDRLAGRA